MGGELKAWDEARADAGRLSDVSVVGIVRLDCAGFLSGTAPLVQNKALGRMATDSGISPTSNKVTG